MNIMSKCIYKAALLTLAMVPLFAGASHWSYDGEGSPEHWSQLSDEYKTCQQGMNQFPSTLPKRWKRICNL
jgi:carbonic anhydrase